MWPWPSLVHSKLAALTPRNKTGSPWLFKIFVPATWSGSGAFGLDARSDAQPGVNASAAITSRKNEAGKKILRAKIRHWVATGGGLNIGRF
jgi:hypothetical protein